MAFWVLKLVNEAICSLPHIRVYTPLPRIQTQFPPFIKPLLILIHTHSFSKQTKTPIPLEFPPLQSTIGANLFTMFLTEKHRSVPVFPSPIRFPFSDPFDTALSSRLLSLLPIPASSSASDNLPWLSRACDLLSLTISDATTSLLLHKPSSLNPSPFLDSTSLSLLDSCNSISAFSDNLLRRLLYVRFSLKSHNPSLPEKNHLPQLSVIRSVSLMEKPPRGEIDAVKKAIYAVEAVCALVLGAILVTLSGNGMDYFEGLKVNDEIYSWGKAFNKVSEAVSKRIGEGSVNEELEKMEAMIGRLTAEMDLEVETEKRRFCEMERTSEDMREGLEKLKASVNAVFQAAMCGRNAAVQSLLVGAQQKKCK
ncbi:hypothetical protein LUZ63_011227 [Rhynchospora breviuscula]|uniref:Uncharacterized protein n=1 Tax=Rhynchospora breviuscula TaxID=2022672 RepID=A0A9Q0HQC1_9POAL|nr:hypothetical protein LUZ63_011227 [Rhynchospora breviuscula]